MPVQFIQEDVTFLQKNLSKLSSRDADFAKKIIAYYNRHSYISPGYAPYFEKFTAQIKGGVKPVEAPKAVDLNLTPVIELFNLAAKSLKHPRIRLNYGGVDYVLALAGADSANPGTVNVQTKGTFDSRIWFGRITKFGMFQPGKTQAKNTAVIEMLKAIAADPFHVAQIHGQKYNHCMFCGLELTDARSVAAGFGPICAEKWGLEAQWADAVHKAVNLKTEQIALPLEAVNA
jgi:hypothetical protein